MYRLFKVECGWYFRLKFPLISLDVWGNILVNVFLLINRNKMISLTYDWLPCNKYQFFFGVKVGCNHSSTKKTQPVYSPFLTSPIVQLCDLDDNLESRPFFVIVTFSILMIEDNFLIFMRWSTSTLDSMNHFDIRWWIRVLIKS